MVQTGKQALVVKNAPGPEQPEKQVFELFGPTIGILALGTGKLFATKRVHIKNYRLKIGGDRFW